MEASSFTTEDLLRAMAPIQVVLDTFCQENLHCWSNVESQGQFAGLVKSENSEEYGPPASYLKSLVRQYVARVEASPGQVEDEKLLSMILFYSMSKDCTPLNPLESGYVSFRIPQAQNDVLRLCVFPRHNDVALKLWEAGACLAEYLLQNPSHVAGKKCCELGAGVGLTGLVVAACCEPVSYLMTDYTEAALINLKHNTQINTTWLRKWLVDSDTNTERIITQAYLDWEEYANGSSLPTSECSVKCSDSVAGMVSAAQVLLAADVVYDVRAIPCLVHTVHRFLSAGSDKVAIFASTLRNEKTFNTFEDSLSNQGIDFDFVDNETLESINFIFPVYHVQPRSDIRICFMKLSNRKSFS